MPLSSTCAKTVSASLPGSMPMGKRWLTAHSAVAIEDAVPDIALRE